MNRNVFTILVVDDDPAIRRLFRMLLGHEFSVCEARSGEEAVSLAVKHCPDLVLLDVNLPGIDGYETCRQLSDLRGEQFVSIVLVSARSSRSEQQAGYEAGADDYIVKPIDPHEFVSRVELHFRLRMSMLETTEAREKLHENQCTIQKLNESRLHDLIATQDAAVFTLAKVAESRDNETGNHLIRMRGYAQILAECLSCQDPYEREIDAQFLSDMFRSSPLHDIGKVAIPDFILLKPGKLTDDEMHVMQQHAIIGAEIMQDAVANFDGGGFLEMAAEIARSHHERWDGGGYPDGKAGADIPLVARIVAVADVFDALTSKRPYKDAMHPDDARRVIDQGSGSHFEPAIVAAFHDCYPRLLTIHDHFQDGERSCFDTASYLNCESISAAYG